MFTCIKRCRRFEYFVIICVASRSYLTKKERYSKFVIYCICIQSSSFPPTDGRVGNGWVGVAKSPTKWKWDISLQLVLKGNSSYSTSRGNVCTVNQNFGQKSKKKHSCNQKKNESVCTCINIFIFITLNYTIHPSDMYT